MPAIEILKRDIASFKLPITLENKFLLKSVHLTEAPHLSLNQETQNIHKGALKSVQGHQMNSGLILKVKVAPYHKHLQREDSR